MQPLRSAPGSIAPWKTPALSSAEGCSCWLQHSNANRNEKNFHKVNSTTMKHAKNALQQLYFLFPFPYRSENYSCTSLWGFYGQLLVIRLLWDWLSIQEPCTTHPPLPQDHHLGWKSPLRTVARALQIAWCKCLTLACIACSHKRGENYVERIINTLLKTRCNRNLNYLI